MLERRRAFGLLGLRRLSSCGLGGDEHVALPSIDGAVKRNALLRRRQQGKRLAHQHLGLRARNEHAGTHLHRDMAKRRLAGDVLQRLPSAAARDEPAKLVAIVHGQRAVEVHIQLDARQPARFGQQPFGGQARVLVAFALQIADGPIERGLDGPDVGHC